MPATYNISSNEWERIHWTSTLSMNNTSQSIALMRTSLKLVGEDSSNLISIASTSQ